jgi:hypothetical protein
MEKDRYKILRKQGVEHHIPLFLESNLDEMGVMVGFDGDLEQVNQVCNFTYTQNNLTVTVTNSVNTSKIPSIEEVVYTVEWGDGTSAPLPIQGTVTKTYETEGVKRIGVHLKTPWEAQRIERNIPVPQDNKAPQLLGVLDGVVKPIDAADTAQEQVAETDAVIKFAAMGASRISEKKLYGSDNYEGVTIGTIDNVRFSGYTIDNLYYQDFEDGLTYITGVTTDFEKEAVFDNMLSRNEHFIGFIDEPTIFSDIFVDRGKQSVMEKTFRLGEIDNMGELSVYGNGYFSVRKQ